jgi:hypothetical protein
MFGAAHFDASVEGGREAEIAAMFIDLRGSTSLATDWPPYDALFLLDRFALFRRIAPVTAWLWRAGRIKRVHRAVRLRIQCLRVGLRRRTKLMVRARRL